MIDHAINLKAVSASAISAVTALLFGQPVEVVLMAFSGGCAALSFAANMPFVNAVGYVTLSTIGGALGAGGVVWALKDFPAGLAALVCGVITVPLLKGAFRVAGKVPEKASEKWLR